MRILVIGIILWLVAFSNETFGQAYRPPSPSIGVASYYAEKFHGRLTANGEVFDMHAMTSAHNSLPMGTYIKVTNLRNHKWVVVRVNDRLHHRNRRVVDLTHAAAKKLGFFHRGLTRVKVEVVDKAFVQSLPQK